ncbi:MAG: hypothetical protein ABSB66_09410 [Candidatus Acidiferrales bacterium]
MPASFALIAGALAKKFNQGKAPGNGQQENLFDDGCAAVDAVMNLVCLGLLCGNNRADVLQKIDSAFLARAAFALFVLAGRAFVPQRGVATRAEARDLAGVRTAFKAFNHALRGSACIRRRSDSSARHATRARFGRRVAGFAGRKASTHPCILALQPRLKCSAERKCGFAVNTAPRTASEIRANSVSDAGEKITPPRKPMLSQRRPV